MSRSDSLPGRSIPKRRASGVAQLEGLPARAYGAHLNAFEAFPPFAAAVIIAHLVEGASTTINVLAMLFILARLAPSCGFYLADRQPLRSAAFFVGLVADDRHFHPDGVPLSEWAAQRPPETSRIAPVT